MKIGIIGCGAYGMALASVVDDNNHSVIIWTKFKEEKDLLEKNRENDKAIPGYILPNRIQITTDLKKCIEESELLVIAIPIEFLEETLVTMKKYIKDNHIVIATKGIKNNGLLLHEIIEKNLDTNNVAILSGPTFAIDLVSKTASGLTIASKSTITKLLVKKAFNTNYIKLSYTEDIVGTELCGAIKNIAAITMGTLRGLNANESTQAMMLTELILNIERIILDLNGNRDTILSFAGIGDLLLTCTSIKSRNFTFGKLIGENKSKQEIDNYLKNTTVEGVYTLKSVYKLLNNKSITSSFINTMYNIVFGSEEPKEVLKLLVDNN